MYCCIVDCFGIAGAEEYARGRACCCVNRVRWEEKEVVESWHVGGLGKIGGEELLCRVSHGRERWWVLGNVSEPAAE